MHSKDYVSGGGLSILFCKNRGGGGDRGERLLKLLHVIKWKREI